MGPDPDDAAWEDVDEDVRLEQDNDHAAEVMAEMYDDLGDFA